MAILLNWLSGLDHAVLRTINGLAGRFAFLDWLARVGADDHIILIFISILLIGVLLVAGDRPGRERAAACIICAVIAVVLAVAATYLANSLFFRPKPFTSQAVNLIFYRNTDSAFPSNAAALTFALSFAVLFFNRKIGVPVTVLAAYACFARIMVGVHYPLDIAGGMLLGLAAAMISRGLLPLYRGAAARITSIEYRFLAGWRMPGGASPNGKEQR